MKNPVVHFLLWAFVLNPPVYAQESIEIEIDSAPVEVEVKKTTRSCQGGRKART